VIADNERSVTVAGGGGQSWLRAKDERVMKVNDIDFRQAK